MIDRWNGQVGLMEMEGKNGKDRMDGWMGSDGWMMDGWNEMRMDKILCHLSVVLKLKPSTECLSLNKTYRERLQILQHVSKLMSQRQSAVHRSGCPLAFSLSLSAENYMPLALLSRSYRKWICQLIYQRSLWPYSLLSH